jgi:hypothetical protein
MTEAGSTQAQALKEEAAHDRYDGGVQEANYHRLHNNNCGTRSTISSGMNIH